MNKVEKIIDAHDMRVPLSKVITIPHNRNTIGFAWRDVEGTPDGKILVYGSNLMSDEADYSLIHTINVNSEDNEDDTTYIHISAPVFTLIKIVYTPNNITAGELTADINRSDA